MSALASSASSVSPSLRGAETSSVMPQPSIQRINLTGAAPARSLATERLEDCSAAEAITLWLDGDYQCGDETALLVAIRRQAPSDLTDFEIKEVIHEASERGRSAAAVLTHLLSPRAAEPAASTDVRTLRPHG